MSTPILAELWKQAKPYSNKAIPNKEKGNKKKKKKKVNWMIGERDSAILEASGPVHLRDTGMTTTYRDEIPF